VKEHDTRLWHRPSLGRGCARADFASVKRVAIDETAARCGHGYVTLFVGIDQRRVLSVADGRDANTVAAFADDLEAHKGDASRIKEVCIDMSGAFIKGVDYNLTEAEITFDEFHAVKLVNDAVDKVRCAESKDRPELKRSRYLWLKNERHLSAEQSANLNALSSMHLKTARARSQATHVKQRRAKKSGLPVGKSSAYSSRNQRAYCDNGSKPPRWCRESQHCFGAFRRPSSLAMSGNLPLGYLCRTRSARDQSQPIIPAEPLNINRSHKDTHE
jgi:hypothetical protein